MYMPTIGKATIMMLLRNLCVLTPEHASFAVLSRVSNSMRLRSYREVQRSAASQSS